jgi:hypothetical protein
VVCSAGAVVGLAGGGRGGLIGHAAADVEVAGELRLLNSLLVSLSV